MTMLSGISLTVESFQAYPTKALNPILNPKPFLYIYIYNGTLWGGIIRAWGEHEGTAFLIKLLLDSVSFGAP